jgi:7,8-dihydropterin-6-yl-methyl-4-(beta-D-ribofuranosyl)aminobenzene 5'-phosphate synthase
LFDTGRGETLLHNLDVFNINPSQIDGVVLSHGHNDHAGGLFPLLQEIGSRPVHAHPQIFADRYWQGIHERREISIPYRREIMEEAGARFVWQESFAEIDAGLYFSGVIPRKHSLEIGDPHLVCCDAAGNITPDAFNDDGALAVNTERGLVVLLGCAHAGLINTVEHFRQHLPGRPIYAIVGGTHLGPASDDQFAATLEYLDRLAFTRLGLSHCTGQIRAAQLHARYPNKVFFANVGSVMEVN